MLQFRPPYWSNLYWSNLYSRTFSTIFSYEAIRFYLESVNNGQNAHTIDWGNPAFSAFTTEQYTKDDYSFEDGSTQAYKKQRGNFILSAKTFLLQPSHRYILHHNGKPVPRPSQYGDILRESQLVCISRKYPSFILR